MHCKAREERKSFEVHCISTATLLTYSVVADIEQGQYDRVILLESTEIEGKHGSLKLRNVHPKAEKSSY